LSSNQSIEVRGLSRLPRLLFLFRKLGVEARIHCLDTLQRSHRFKPQSAPGHKRFFPFLPILTKPVSRSLWCQRVKQHILAGRKLQPSVHQSTHLLAPCLNGRISRFGCIFNTRPPPLFVVRALPISTFPQTPPTRDQDSEQGEHSPLSRTDSSPVKKNGNAVMTKKVLKLDCPINITGTQIPFRFLISPYIILMKNSVVLVASTMRARLFHLSKVSV
jgi:hypothetical protein